MGQRRAILTIVARADGRERYLRYVIERIAQYPINRIEEFLPWNLADALRTETRRHLAA